MIVGLLSDRSRLIRCIVLLICSVIATYQLHQCFFKLFHPPRTSYSRYELSNAMVFPAVTICREPAYKIEVLAEYNIHDHPNLYWQWNNFSYEINSMTSMFERATYNQSETFLQYSLAGDQQMVDIESSLQFNLGKCHTLRPKASVPVKRSFIVYGYNLTLNHDLHRYSQQRSPGWHIFIHGAKESFSEIVLKTSSRNSYVYAEVEEFIEIKLQKTKYNILDPYRCPNDSDYSSPKCWEICLWTEIADKVDCTTPWMSEINLPLCNNSESMTLLVQEYNRIYHDFEIEPKCSCQKTCNSVIYSTYIINRKHLKQPKPQTKIWLYYTSTQTKIVEVRLGYDLSQFIADMGGSLGFMLGLSVLGFFGILQKITKLIFRKYFRKKDEESKSMDDAKIITDIV